MADSWKTGRSAREDQCILQSDKDLLSFRDICLPLLLCSACVCISFLFQLCVVLPPIQLIGSRPRKSIPWGTCRQGGSCFVFSLLVSPNPREPAEDWELKAFFLPLIQGTRVRFCGGACLPRGNYSVNVSLSLSYTGSRQCCWDERSGHRGEDSQEIVSCLARELLGSPFSPGCEYHSLPSGSAIPG